MKLLIESESLRKTIGENAYKDVLQNHSTVAYAPLAEKKLRDLITSTGHNARTTLDINWVLKTPVASQGGEYRTIFRLANYLGSRGHKVRLYVEPAPNLEGSGEKAILEFPEKSFGSLAAEVFVGHGKILPADATIATNWSTAYTVASHNASIYKFYFIQDYEPDVYDKHDPQYESAENTYYLPLQPITIGDFLPGRLKELNGRIVESIPFGIDSSVFNVKEIPAQRLDKTRVLFFARPGLQQKEYEIGLKALEIAKKGDPGLQIALFGAESHELGHVPFQFSNLGVLTPEQLAAEMNRSHILLSLSLPNISSVIYEGMACGLAVVELDVPAVRNMVEPGTICLSTPTPEALAAAIVRLRADREMRLKFASAGIEYIKPHTWETTCKRFEKILVDRCIL